MAAAARIAAEAIKAQNTLIQELRDNALQGEGREDTFQRLQTFHCLPGNDHLRDRVIYEVEDENDFEDVSIYRKILIGGWMK